jgi:hypothetical protein
MAHQNGAQIDPKSNRKVMKEQEDILREMDHWLIRQWKEEEFVPTSMEKSVVTQWIAKKRRWKRWLNGLTMAIMTILLLLLSLFFTKSVPKKEQHKPKVQDLQQEKILENKPTEQSTYVPMKTIALLAVDQLQPSVLEMGEDLEQIDLPEKEILAAKVDPLSTGLFVDLDSIMYQLGIFFLQTSTFNKGSHFAGITSRHQLIVSRMLDGSDDYPHSPDSTSSEGGFRPHGMSKNQYVQYAMFDVRQLLFNEAIYRKVLAINTLPRIAYNMRTNAPGWSNPVYSDVNTYVPQPKSIAELNQDQNMRQIAQREGLRGQYPIGQRGRSNYFRKAMRVNYQAKVGLLIGDNFLIKSQGDRILVVSCDAERVSMVDQNGIILASHPINIQKPRYFSQKAKYPFYDEESQRLYLIVETNFSYMWFEVDQFTGEAKFIFKTETIWNQPNWKISGGILSYEFKGKNFQQRLD